MFAYLICLKCGHGLQPCLDSDGVINLTCPSCGGNEFKTDTSIVLKCPSCQYKGIFYGGRSLALPLAGHQCEGNRFCFMLESPDRTKREEEREKCLQQQEAVIPEPKCQGHRVKIKVAIPFYYGGVNVERAARTWIHPETVFFLNDKLIIPPGSGICSQIYSSKNARDLGLSKKCLPMLIDVFKNLFEAFPNEDYYGYVNSDIILPPHVPISSLVPAEGKNASVHHRIDVYSPANMIVQEMRGQEYIVIGKDGFFLTREVMLDVIEHFPDMILGWPFWDTALALYLFKRHGGKDKLDLRFGELYHVYHKSSTTAVEEQQTPEGQFNRAQAEKACGMGEYGSHGIWMELCNDGLRNKSVFGKRKKIGIIQPGRLGDIIICLPIAKYYYEQGYEVHWPVMRQWFHLFDRINYVRAYALPGQIGASYMEAKQKLAELGKLDICLDLAIGFGRDQKEWEASGLTFDAWKYKEAGLSIEAKYRLEFRREAGAERALLDAVGANDFKNGYVITASSSSFAKFDFGVPGGRIEVAPIEGFCFFDWVGVLERAEKILCVDSALLNLVNQAGLLPGARYYWTWHNVREKVIADRNTPHLTAGWERFVPLNYGGRNYPPYLEDNNAMQHIQRFATKYCHPGFIGVDIGGGQNPYPYAARVIDFKRTGVDVDDLDSFGENLDYIFSSHMLEHLQDMEGFFKRAAVSLRPQGILFLYLPHPDCGWWSPERPQMQGRFGHKRLYRPKEVVDVMRTAGFRIVTYSRTPDYYYSFYLVGRKEK